MVSAIHFDEEKQDEARHTDCPICLDNISAETEILTHCGHAFCKDCLADLVSKSIMSCSICRTKFVKCEDDNCNVCKLISINTMNRPDEPIHILVRTSEGCLKNTIRIMLIALFLYMALVTYFFIFHRY